VGLAFSTTRRKGEKETTTWSVPFLNIWSNLVNKKALGNNCGIKMLFLVFFFIS
jgi:hypothetical protein